MLNIIAMANKIINLDFLGIKQNKVKYSDIDPRSIACEATLNSEKAIKSALYNILTWKPGQRVLFPEFGNASHKYVYEHISSGNIQNLKQDIR